MNKGKLIELISKCLDEEDIIIDIEILLSIINSNELTLNELTLYLVSISKNIEFFRRELNYSLQLSNLLLFELDAREIKSNRGRGTEYRLDLIELYKNNI